MQATVRLGDPYNEGIVYPRVAEVSLAGGIKVRERGFYCFFFFVNYIFYVASLARFLLFVNYIFYVASLALRCLLIVCALCAASLASLARFIIIHSLACYLF